MKIKNVSKLVSILIAIFFVRGAYAITLEGQAQSCTISAHKEALDEIEEAEENPMLCNGDDVSHQFFRLIRISPYEFREVNPHDYYGLDRSCEAIIVSAEYICQPMSW